MIPLNRWAAQAAAKLEEGKKNVSGQKERVMAPAVAAQLATFCRQNEEFAVAVAYGGPFSECMKQVANGVGNSISDLDAYKKAVQFYFPGAKVEMQLTITLSGKPAAETPKEKPKADAQQGKVISLNLEDFF